MAITNSQIVNYLGPWFGIISGVFSASQRDQLAAIPILGLPRKTERANDYHRAARENFRRVCDSAFPLLELVEEPDGQGLDYLVSRLGDSPVAIRWGLYKNGRIKRNQTDRTRTCQEQGLLPFPDMDLDVQQDEMPLVTVGFTLDDDYTEVGLPCWWISRLVLLREREGDSEVITTIKEFSAPAGEANEYLVPDAIVEAREAELEEWNAAVQEIKNNAA